VSGGDATRFLNGLCTRNMLNWSAGTTNCGKYAAFLNGPGRLMYESFIFRETESSYLLDCDVRVLSDFAMHLRQFRLKSAVAIEENREYSVLADWSGKELQGDFPAIKDERAQNWDMRRILIPRDKVESRTDAYEVLRLTHGIPEGPQEIPRGKAIPMEYNMDLMGASKHAVK